MNVINWLRVVRKLPSLFQILVKPGHFIFNVREDETVLEAALRCGYFFPNLCRMGVCGTCKGKLLQGEVEYIREEMAGLTASERENGDVLFCSVKPKSDLIIEVSDFGKMELSAKDFIYTVKSAELLTKNITQLILYPSSSARLVYQAGQYIEIIHSDGSRSPLSIANAPHENLHIELQLSHSPENTQAKDILRIASEEKKLIVRGPYGSCVAGKFLTDRPVVFLARGTGFAPIKAMIEQMIQFKKYPSMCLYWSASTPDEFYMDELLTRWVREIKDFTFVPVLSRPYPEWPGKIGLLQNVILEDCPEIVSSMVYVSAPEPIVHDVLHVLQAAGLSREHYFSDLLS